jgi:nitrite reductase (NADH) large subunit
MEKPMKKLKLVMVGNGMAGVRTLEELIKVAPDLYDITVFGAEPHPNYNRILLSPVLAGEQTLDEIVLNSWDWYKENNVTLHAGKKVVQVDRVRRIVRAEDGTEEEYDRLLMCTGSSPFILPVPGKDLQGVIAYRDIADTNAMIEASQKYKKAVVIGGGLLGLEAANGLMLRGMDVTVVHVMPWLMERQLDDVAGKLLQKSLEDRGLKFLIGAQTQELTGNEAGRVKSIRFKDGTEVETDLVVMAVGIRPNTTLAESMRLHCEPRHRGHRHHADRDRRTHLQRGRVRCAPRHCLRPGGAAVRAGQGRSQPPGAVRHWPLQRLAHVHQAQGHRH